MNPRPDKFMPALYGGIIMALVSTIPFVSFINCFCCAGILLGGFLAVFFYKNNMMPDSPPLNAGDCMVVGLFAGIIGAVVGSMLSMLFLSLFGNIMGEALLRWLGELNLQIPEESWRRLEDASRKTAGLMNFIIQLFTNLVLYDIFGLLGGLIAYSVYKPKQSVMMPPPPGGTIVSDMNHPHGLHGCRRRLLVCAASFVFIVQISAQPQNNPDKEGYEVTGHRASLHLYPESNLITCTDTVTLRLINRSIDKLHLGLNGIYEVSEVAVNNQKENVRRERNELVLEDLPNDTLLRVTVTYAGVFPSRTEFSSWSPDHATLREEEVLPFGPKAEEFVRLTVAVPRGWDVITVGRQMISVSREDTTTSVWEIEQPIPFIGWICAGKFSKRQRDAPPVPMTSYLHDSDSSSSESILALSAKVLRFYSARFSPYRFDELNIVEIDDLIGGRNLLAIALPSFVMVKKFAFTTPDRFNRVDAVLPHEIAHQWWPITVYVEEEDGAFLSEGMCEYSSMLYNEASDSRNRRDSLKVHPLLRSLISRIIKGKDLPLQMKADLRSLPTHYLKSAFVHNMLRRLIGDSVFSMLYREYASRYALRRVGLKDFHRLAEELSGKKLSLFFDQWVKKKGVPRLKIYNVKSVQAGKAWQTKGRVRMVGYENFTTNVDIGVQTSSGMFKRQITVGMDTAGVYRNDVPFEIATDEKPSLALLDPDGDILKIQKLPVKIVDLRDPGDGIMVVGTHTDKARLLSLARRDSSEMELGGWSIRIKYDAEITLADLQQERLILYGKPAENSLVDDLEEKFQVRLRNDSVVVNHEAVYDSELTLIQAIESPYISQGMICWVAPLSPKAQPELLPFDASWVLIRGKEEISSGTWDVKDGDITVEIR